MQAQANADTSSASTSSEDASSRTGWVWGAILSALSVLVMLQASPWVVQTPGNDSGIFLYFGAQIRRGRLPFVDLWDHKPPLVFYLDALGFLLGGGSRWGVWAIEVVSLLAASLCAFFFLRRYFRSWPAGLAVTGMLLNLVFLLEGGNLTEEYALAFQFAALLLFAGTVNQEKVGWRGFGIGAAMAGAFLLKQTLIGVWITLAIYLLAAALFTRAWRGLKLFLPMIAGFALVVLASAGYFALRGALREYWDVAFWYNFVYSSVSLPERVSSLGETLSLLNTRSGFFLLALMAWFAGLGYVLLHHEPARRVVTRRWVGLVFLAGALLFLNSGLFVKPFQFYAFSALSLYRWSLIAVGLLLAALGLIYLLGWPERRVLPWLEAHAAACDSPRLLPVYLALIDLPLNLALVSLSGRGYLHYNLSLLPSLTLLIAFLAGSLLEPMRAAGTRSGMAWVWSAALLLPLTFGGAAQTIHQIHPGSDSQTTRTVAYIQANTNPNDTILLWGTQTGIYYLSGRESPTRYVHQIPLFNFKYADTARFNEFIHDLETRKPALIIDTRLAHQPLIYQRGDPEACASAQTEIPVPPGMSAVYAYICSHYELVETIGKDSWIIYRYNPAVQPITKTK